jgi:hypothetical protein
MGLFCEFRIAQVVRVGQLLRHAEGDCAALAGAEHSNSPARCRLATQRKKAGAMHFA